LIKAIAPNTPHLEGDFYPSLANPAVALCVEAWQAIHKVTWEQTRNPYTAERCAGKAYRLAMPPLTGYQNICDFIACAGYGMLLGAFKADAGGKFLYAAQVALGAITQQAKTQTRTHAATAVLPDSTPTTPPVSLHPVEKNMLT
jgi:hypothetical protein